MHDPIEELLATPRMEDGAFDPLEVTLPRTDVETLFAAAYEWCQAELARVREAGANEMVVALRRRALQQAVNALAWVRGEGATVQVGLYPIDPRAQREQFERLAEEFPDVGDEEGERLPF